ncbi:MAG: hypothetical protein AB7J19_07180 [Beijerinckiaceae bacterium]
MDDDNLWKQLVDLAADSSLGRRYLHKVRNALRGFQEGRCVERAKLIDRKVKSRGAAHLVAKAPRRSGS